MYSLVTSGLVTYADLMHKLTLEEVLDLIEILIVKESNANLALDSVE